jgi:hypothetical protein
MFIIAELESEAGSEVDLDFQKAGRSLRTEILMASGAAFFR